jgi:hypothetical protein
LHTAQQSVASWETEVNEPRLAVIEKIAAASGTTPCWRSGSGMGLLATPTTMD